MANKDLKSKKSADSLEDFSKKAREEGKEVLSSLEDLAKTLGNVDEESDGDTLGKEGISPLEKKQLEVTEWKDQYLYLRAELENLKKNHIKERSDLIKYSNSRILTALVEITDLLGQALDQDFTKEKSIEIIKGIELTFSKFKKVLNNFGLTEISTENSAFDPNVCEALSSEESEVVPEGHILHTIKKAYKLHDRVIRHGQVIVAKSPSKKSSNKINLNEKESDKPINAKEE